MALEDYFVILSWYEENNKKMKYNLRAWAVWKHVKLNIPIQLIL